MLEASKQSFMIADLIYIIWDKYLILIISTAKLFW